MWWMTQSVISQKGLLRYGSPHVDILSTRGELPQPKSMWTNCPHWFYPCYGNLVSTEKQHLPDFTVAWQNVKSRLSVTWIESMCSIWTHWTSCNVEDVSGEWRFVSFTTSTGHFDQLILGVPFSLHGFPAPFRRRFPARSCEVFAGYPMQTVFRFSRCGAGSGNKNRHTTTETWPSLPGWPWFGFVM